ncbi:RNA-guided endonuclease TnpB family protein [Vulcanisaeta sp. JCM 14467]|uniref:RNA-guided endonuclease TnpB family protein n=1 Tax=Vulcanisaeta sp. JCM 14467 TaxID=1295370 RepID=UPI00209269C2|nr:RNA-guided endonuclease TnpB family protein [Vulcanisaeta sp. JCM 14467]
MVKSAKSNNGNKPRVRKFTARLDYQDAKVELNKGIVRIILRDRWYVLRLRHRREYIERFLGLRWKEVHVKYENKRLFVSIIFETRYQPYIPRGFTAIDINLRTVTTYNGTEIRRYRTRLIDALSKRARAEELQRRYPKRWRYNERILSRIKALHRRTRNIINDSSWKLAKEIVTKAYKHKHAIILEDLEHLRDSINGKDDGIRWKLTLFAYRRLRHAVIAKAIEHNVPVIIVDPRNTSTTCPRCGSRLTYIHRLAFCRNCGFIGDRDVVGAMNIWLRAVQACAGLPGSTQSASPMNNETRERGGKQNEEMKKTNRPKPSPCSS